MFKKKEAVKRNGKFLIYGGAGTGKTYFALGAAEHLPKGKRLLYMGNEGGADLYGDRFDFDATEETRDLGEIQKNLHRLHNEKHNYGALVIDTVTDWYTCRQLLFHRNGKNGREIPLRAWAQIKPQHFELVRTALSLPMHVILLAHEKVEKELIGSELKTKGIIPDAGPKDSHEVDIFFRLCMEKGERYAYIEKDRTDKAFKIGQTVKDPGFGTWALKLLNEKPKRLDEPAFMNVADAFESAQTPDELNEAYERQKGFIDGLKPDMKKELRALYSKNLARVEGSNDM